MRRRTRVFLALVTTAVLAAGAIVAGAMAGGWARGRSGAARQAAVGVAHTVPAAAPTVPYVRAMPSACFIAGRTCSIHPCVEYVGQRSLRLLRAPSACDVYPRARGLPVRIRR